MFLISVGGGVVANGWVKRPERRPGDPALTCAYLAMGTGFDFYEGGPCQVVRALAADPANQSASMTEPRGFADSAAPWRSN